MANKEKKEKRIITLNPYVMLCGVILVCFIVSFFVQPGAFDREVVDGRNVVVAGSYHPIEKESLTFLDLFRSIPNGLVGSATVVFLILIVGGAIEIYNQTGAIPAAISRFVSASEGKSGTAVLVILFTILAVLGGFMGWIEASIPFIPLIIPIILALGYDSMTAVAVCILGSMVGFALGPTNMYSVGISQEIAELPMFSGIGLRSVAYVVFCTVAIIYIIIYANKVKKDPSKSLVKDVDISDIKVDFSSSDIPQLTTRHTISLVVLVACFAVVVYGMMNFGWGIGDMSAVFLFAGIVAGIVGKMGPTDIALGFVEGAKGAMGGAMVVGVARGVEWILTTGGMLDPIINALSKPLDRLGSYGSVVGIFIMVTLLNGLIASGSGKAVALMPIIIPLADLAGITRQTAVFAYQLGDGITNMFWFTYGSLLIFLSYGKVPIGRWYKFLWPLMIIFNILALIFLFVALQIGYA